MAFFTITNINVFVSVVCFLCTSCLGLSYCVSVCENACSPNYVSGLNLHCCDSVQWFKMCVCLCVFGTHRKAFSALFLVSNRENWSWKLVFNIKELRVHSPSPLSPRFFNTSSALSLKRDTHFFFFAAPALRHPFPSSLRSLSSSWRWFMLVIVGKTCCRSTGVIYAHCKMCVNLSALSDSPTATFHTANL